MVDNMKSWIKEHETTVVTIGTALGLWVAITSSFHRDIDRIENKISAMEEKVSDMDKRLTSVETILIMQGAPLKSYVASPKVEKEGN